MRIRLSQLRQMIREAVEEAAVEEANVDELDELGGLGGDVASDEEYDAIVSEGLRARRLMGESLGEIAMITMGTFIGISAVLGFGRLKEIAEEIRSNVASEYYHRLTQKAEEARDTAFQELVERLSGDQQLIAMFEELKNMKGVASRAEIEAKSKQITSYVRLASRGGPNTGKNSVAARVAVGRKLGY